MSEQKKIKEIINELELCELENKNFTLDFDEIPSRKNIEKILELTLAFIFPKCFFVGNERSSYSIAEELYYLISGEIRVASTISQQAIGLSNSDCDSIALEILSSLPKIKSLLMKDIIATYRGDPAASSVLEVILSYPGFFALFTYRFAHEFYIRNVGLIPRMISEIAHERCGIDIHPGAKIGEYFCIDHGTGIVIGETAKIGDRVKIYQGVTIGAKSFATDSSGNLIKGGKRHPDIGNDVIIYAGATILGGDTVIGDRCIIGGNVWLTHSLPSDSKIYYKEK